MDFFHFLVFLSFFYLFISQKSSNFALVIELDRHIEILLLSNDCVIVPGLGGFMAHHADARYDEEDHTFLPPLRTLGYNPQLTMNDSLLVQSYVEAYDMSYPEALRRIEDEVNELKQHLENEGRYDLNDIGVLSVNEDGKYIFSPCEAGILTPQFYGLSSFEMAPLDELKRQQKAPVPVVEIAAEPAEPADTLETTDVTETETIEEEEEERAIVIKMSWVRNAVAVAAAVLAFFLMTTPVTNSENSHQSMGNLNNSILVGMMPKDSNMKKVDMSKIDAPKPVVKKDSVAPVKEATKTVTKTDTASVIASQELRYCIVLASYISKKNANAFVEELQQKGYAEARVYIRNNVTRVIYGNFKTVNEAYNKLNSIQKRKGLEEAWVLKVKDES
ncbi:MAG: SPOR domain-containing protein [Prevotella sp.]|nr:SPOR domain-containing protein [Prevotella sp.]